MDALVGDDSYPQHAELLQALFSGADMVFPVLGREPDEQDEPGEEVVAAAEPKKGRRQPPGSRGRLSIRNRLLFAVLLSRSDQFGEVQISLSELARCVGMRPEQVKNRLVRLMAVGLIRRYVPGLASLIFKAGRVSSTYFLNLDILGARGAIAVHVDPDREEKRRTHVDHLCGSVSYFASGGRARNLKVPRSVLYFLKGERQEVFPLLQHLINGYASRVLSRHWDALGSEASVEDSELMRLIKSGFRCPAAGLGPNGSLNEVYEYFYSLAIDVAREYRGRFVQADWVDFTSVEVRILPTVDERGYEAITVMFRPTPTGLANFTTLEDKALGGLTVAPARSEADLSLRERWEFGLVTLPDKMTRAWSQ
ncbi:TPA: hypothetical protein L4V02_001440 [Pseudomonas aeruginosa]|nr:hypothetical protein [Pseudomonas aeruginosa]